MKKSEKNIGNKVLNLKVAGKGRVARHKLGEWMSYKGFD